MWKLRNHLFEKNYSRRENHTNNPATGFTMVEVIVALTILSTTIIAIFGAMRSCSTAAAHTRMQTKAVLLAESLLTETRINKNLSFETTQGSEDLYRWQVQIAPTAVESLGAICVQVNWQEQQRQQRYELVSLVQMKSFAGQ